MSTYLSTVLRNQLLQADDHQCAYCQTSVYNTGQPLTVDHIIPLVAGGKTVFDNLCFACRRCNESKSGAQAAQDPLTGEKTPLFHPRRDSWDDHFAWDGSGIHIIGLTAVGRATVLALAMNDQTITGTRRRWVSVGWHPP